MTFLNLIFVFLCCSFSLDAAPTPSQSPAYQDQFIQYLAQEKAHRTLAIAQLQQSDLPKDETEYKAKMNQLSSMLIMTQAKIQSLEGFLENQNKQKTLLEQEIKYLQQLPVAKSGSLIQERVLGMGALLEINKKSMDLTNENLFLAKKFVSLLQDEIKKIQLWKQERELEQQLVTIKTKEGELTQELSRLYQENIDYYKTNYSQNKTRVPLEGEAYLLLNNQQSNLIHQRIHALHIKNRFIQANQLLLNNQDAKILQTAMDIYRECIKQYALLENSSQQILMFLHKEAPLFSNPEFKKSLNSLQKAFQGEKDSAALEKKAAITGLVYTQNEFKKLVSTRQSLSEYNLDTLPVLLNKILKTPSLLLQYLQDLALKVVDSYAWLDSFHVITLWVLLVSCLSIFFVLNRFLKTWSNQGERSRLAGYLYDGLLTLLQRNSPYLCGFALLWLLFYFTHISFASYQLLFYLLSVWFAFRVLILIARLALLERISDSSGQDVKLYYRLKWLLVFGGWVTAFMVFSHMLPLPLLLQDIFNRLFMLFILTISLVIWKSRDLIPYLLRPLLKYKKRYFKNAIFLLATLIPITLFTSAVIGLLGFVNLAWNMCLYQAYLLLVLVGYVLIRGLVFDALELGSEWMIDSLGNGWLWIEVFLKPLDKIFRILLFLFSVFILFQLYGWNADSWVVLSLEKIAKYSIVHITGIHITVVSTLEFFILVSLFVWAAKWTREFCYRWLYKDTKDVGIRNSLSVFTQYAVILLGTFATLHVWGLDFSGMSMILGGLAVGMGFGLRDFASNIIGGIMLLIERPVREGDLITLGEYEGRVAHIGIRSMRVSSWDNMEVLIPNAETFNKPFTNWTHQDSIVRTVVPIKVSRSDDPVMIQQLILDVLAIIPEIVPNPSAQVFLKQIDAGLIEFEVRYFINVQLYTRFEVRSKVLFAITAQFNAAGVRPPIEPICVEFQEGHDDFLVKKDAT